MKVNRPVNDCWCWNCRNYDKCQQDGVFEENPHINFCFNYEDVTFQDDGE